MPLEPIEHVFITFFCFVKVQCFRFFGHEIQFVKDKREHCFSFWFIHSSYLMKREMGRERNIVEMFSCFLLHQSFDDMIFIFVLVAKNK